MSYQVDCLYGAVLVLAGRGHIKQRLMTAFEENLAEIHDDDLPVAVRQTFADIRRQMYQVAPLNGEGAVRASVRKMSPEQASICAKSLVSLYAELLQSADGGQGMLPLGQHERSGVPPFLVKSG